MVRTPPISAGPAGSRSARASRAGRSAGSFWPSPSRVAHQGARAARDSADKQRGARAQCALAAEQGYGGAERACTTRGEGGPAGRRARKAQGDAEVQVARRRRSCAAAGRRVERRAHQYRGVGVSARTRAVRRARCRARRRGEELNGATLQHGEDAGAGLPGASRGSGLEPQRRRQQRGLDVDEHEHLVKVLCRRGIGARARASACAGRG